MKKTLTIIIVLVVLAVLVIWLVARSPESTVPAADTTEILGEDTTSAIDEQLDSLDLGDLDEEFEQIDAELNQL